MFKFKIWGAALLLCFLGLTAQNGMAQETEITDEDLQNYAMVMDSIDVMKKGINVAFNEMIKAEELMQGGRRFKEIRSAKGDEAKLKELNVTDEELTAFKKIQEAKSEKEKELSAAFNSLVKEKIGVKQYKAIKAGLKSDADMKEKYTAFKKEYEAKRADSEE